MASNRVLLVEDDLDVRDTLQDLLESQGLDVIPAANGKQAIDFLTLNDPPGADLVILDLMMPLVSGWEVLHVLTADRSLLRIPVIVLSALPVTRPERANDLVRKPFAFETLVASIRNVLPA
jgi:DNA-binding response OmpR family regulator